MKANLNYDAIVVGAGPAGCSAATVLAQKGRRVALIEKEKFPRYHIGESMLPFSYFCLQRLGVLDKMKASRHTKKYSVAFVSPDGRASVPFQFNTHLDHEASQTWQVVRGEFDQMLLDNAREKGAEIYEETTVRDGIWENGALKGVKAVAKDGEQIEFNAPITIDCSGRDALFITRNGWKIRDAFLNKIAIWTYYKGAKRDPGIDGGATTVAYIPEKGWFWYIPLADDVLSVGVVAEKDYLYNGSTKDLEEIFQREVKNNKWVEEHLAQGQQFGPYRVTGEYSYRSKHCATDGLILAGDAFAFLDPVFSSGVCLALRSGETAADAADEALRDNDFSAARFEQYGAEFCRRIESMRGLVYAFYDPEFSFREYLKKYPDMKGDVTDCLIGNWLHDFDPMFKAMTEFAEVPEKLPHGKPLVQKQAEVVAG